MKGVIRFLLIAVVIVLGLITAAVVCFLIWGINREHRGVDGPLPDGTIIVPPSEEPQVETASLTEIGYDEHDFNWNPILTLAVVCDAIYDEDIQSLKDTGFSEAVSIKKQNHYAAVCSTDDVVVIAFRGTEDLRDWLTNLRVLSTVYDREKGYSLHRGFKSATDSLFVEIVEEIEKQGGKDKQIVITGHSLGAAMATITAFNLHENGPFSPDALVTFGQPLVFNDKMSRYVNDEIGAHYIRVVNRDDLVTRVLRSYFHAGRRLKLPEGKIWVPAATTMAPTLSDATQNEPPGYTRHSSEVQTELLTEEKLQQLLTGNGDQSSQDELPVAMGLPIPSIVQHEMEQYIREIKGQRKPVERDWD